MALQGSARARNDVLAVAVLAATMAWGCDKPTIAEGNTATVGGIEMSVGAYEVRYLEVSDGSNTYEYPRPALVIPITLENVGENDFTYNPSHSTQQMTEAQTPLLYLHPGPEEDLPPESKSLIDGVYLEKGAVDGQITSHTTIKPGETLTDVFLFEVPDDSTRKLILSLPPVMHRSKFPVLFSIDYTPVEPKGPSVAAVGDSIAFGDTKFTLTGTEIAYIKTRDTSQGEGFSSEPLLKIEYRIENEGEESITYDPSHRSVGGRGAALFGKGATYKRVKFSSSTSVEGQKEGTTKIPPGESLEDFVLFDRPPDDVNQLNFEYPASLFGGQGIARYALEYEYADPATPKELEKPKKKKEDEDESKGG